MDTWRRQLVLAALWGWTALSLLLFAVRLFGIWR